MSIYGKQVVKFPRNNSIQFELRFHSHMLDKYQQVCVIGNSSMIKVSDFKDFRYSLKNQRINSFKSSLLRKNQNLSPDSLEIKSPYFTRRNQAGSILHNHAHGQGKCRACLQKALFHDKNLQPFQYLRQLTQPSTIPQIIIRKKKEPLQPVQVINQTNIPLPKQNFLKKKNLQQIRHQFRTQMQEEKLGNIKKTSLQKITNIPRIKVKTQAREQKRRYDQLSLSQERILQDYIQKNKKQLKSLNKKQIKKSMQQSNLEISNLNQKFQNIYKYLKERLFINSKTSFTQDLSCWNQDSLSSEGMRSFNNSEFKMSTNQLKSDVEDDDYFQRSKSRINSPKTSKKLLKSRKRLYLNESDEKISQKKSQPQENIVLEQNQIQPDKFKERRLSKKEQQKKRVSGIEKGKKNKKVQFKEKPVQKPQGIHYRTGFIEIKQQQTLEPKIDKKQVHKINLSEKAKISNFYRSRDKKAKKLSQILKAKAAAECLLAQNKKQIKKGEGILKQLGLESCIVSQTDSVFLKKKKIRILRELYRKKTSMVNQQICHELFTYLDIFQQNVRLLLRSQKDNKKSEMEDQEDDEQMKKILKQNIWSKELVFYQLCDDYIYGQANEQDQQLNKRCINIAKVAEKSDPKQKNIQKSADVIELMEKAEQLEKQSQIRRRQWDLIQKDLSNLGKMTNCCSQLSQNLNPQEKNGQNFEKDDQYHETDNRQIRSDSSISQGK